MYTVAVLQKKKKEENEAGDAAEDDHGYQDEDPRRLEGSGRDGTKVREAAVAKQLSFGVSAAHAIVEQPEVSDMGGVDAVSDPLGLDEDHHADNGQADGKDGPQNTDGSGGTHVGLMVYFGGVL